MAKRKKKYSSMEKKAYYTGFGVGLTGAGTTTHGITRKAFVLMSEKEQTSYINGYEKGLDNGSIHAGIRNKKNWFK